MDRLHEANWVKLLQDIQPWENLNRKQVTAEVTELLKRTPDGGLTKDIRGKLEVFADYYQDLCVSQEGQQGLWEHFFDSFEIPIITPEQVVLLEPPFTGDERLEAIDSFKANMSPGLGGLTVEFYKKFKKIILTFLQ